MISELLRTTARIHLRRLRVSDLPEFQEYRHSVELGWYQGWVPQSNSVAMAFLDEMSSIKLFQPGVWSQIGIADSLTGKLIGDIGVFQSLDGEDAEIGFTLSKPFHGNGLASEAVCECIAMLFELTPIKRVIGIADSRNEPSIKLLERVGMKLKSTERADFRDEECIELTYVLIRSTE